MKDQAPQAPRVVRAEVAAASSRRVHVVLHLDVPPGTAHDVARALAALLTPEAFAAALGRTG